MTTRQKLLEDYLTHSDEALKIMRGGDFEFLDSDFIWQILIYKFDHYENSTEVLFHNFSIEDIVKEIESYFEEHGLPIESITLNKSIIPDSLNNSLLKAQVKFKGEIWTIHANDKDPFPSRPHAHNYERQYKLHLGNGGLYRKQHVVDYINSKDLIAIRKAISDKTCLTLPSLD